jgi:hypothetical protein
LAIASLLHCFTASLLQSSAAVTAKKIAPKDRIKAADVSVKRAKRMIVSPRVNLEGSLVIRKGLA